LSAFNRTIEELKYFYPTVTARDFALLIAPLRN